MSVFRLGAGGRALAGRIRLTMLCGVATGLLYATVHSALALVPALGGTASAGQMLSGIAGSVLWAVFIFTLLATASALVTEINLPEPKGP